MPIKNYEQLADSVKWKLHEAGIRTAHDGLRFDSRVGGFLLNRGPRVYVSSMRKLFDKMSEAEWETLSRQLSMFSPYYLETEQPTDVKESQKGIIRMQVELKPWVTPNYVIAVVPGGRRQDGTGLGNEPKWPLSAVDSETLVQQCERFRAEVFATAGRGDPALARIRVKDIREPGTYWVKFTGMDLGPDPVLVRAHLSEPGAEIGVMALTFSDASTRLCAKMPEGWAVRVVPPPPAAWGAAEVRDEA